MRWVGVDDYDFKHCMFFKNRHTPGGGDGEVEVIYTIANAVTTEKKN